MFSYPDEFPPFQEYVAAARSYGRHLGIAYQVVDDMLDFTGSAESLGKPALSDMAQVWYITNRERERDGQM